ncbi:MAG: hypothetical protein BWZ03_00686 [bacterium ADurb.BinA186]|nr:MAG: hypothetical protein BWZ03_00686 [bacterium ADurb.BinA186]
MTQPDSLKILAKHGAMVESGFLARWIYIVPDISPGAYPVEEIPTKIREDYFSLVQRLVNSNSSQEVKLSPEAFSAWRTAHDREKILIYEAQRNGNYLLAQWISKLPEQIARLALVLCLSQEKHSLVDRDNMCYAIRWGDFFKSHAQRAFSLMDSNNNKLTTALKVWNWIHKKREFLALKREKEGLEKIEAVKARDLQNAGVANIHDSETAKGILSLLEGKGYLNSKRVKQRGIMEQTIYEIIPTTFIENASDKPDKSDNRDF